MLFYFIPSVISSATSQLPIPSLLYTLPLLILPSVPHSFSTCSEDQGTSFMTISCEKCGILLGKIYRTTPAKLDHIRDFFTFDAPRLFVFPFPPSTSLLETFISFAYYFLFACFLICSFLVRKTHEWGNFEGKEQTFYTEQPSITQVITTDIFPQITKVWDSLLLLIDLGLLPLPAPFAWPLRPPSS